MRLSPNVTQTLELDAEAEFQAVIKMPAEKIASILQDLSLSNARHVHISVDPKEVKFLTRGGEFGKAQIRCKHDANLANPEATIINVEQSVLLSLCLRCLLKYMKAITEEIPKAGQVTMNMSSDPKLPCVIEHTITGTGSTGLYSAHFKCPKEGQ